MTDKKPEDDEYDLSVEKEVAPEENIPWLPHPTPADGDAPAP
jgi:hypothetical protein